MQKFREVQLNLLKELDCLCCDHNIPYILSGHTAYEASKHGVMPEKIVVPTIAMRYSDAKKIASVIDKSARCTESFISNRRISKKVMRYSDRNSTCIRVDDFSQYRNHGICVDIELIRDVPKHRLVNRLCVYFDAFFMLTSEIRLHSAFWRCLLALIIPVEKLILGLMYSDKNKKQDKKLRIPRFPKRSPEFSPSYLTDRKKVELNGSMFYVPTELEGYLKAEFNTEKEWKNSAVSLEDLHLTVVDDKISYNDFEASVIEDCKKSPQIPWFRMYYIRGRMRFLREKIEKYWTLLLFTGDRFAMWKKYMPHKEEICRLFAEGKEQQVLDFLSEYVVLLEKYEKSDLALCFDSDIFKIVLQIFEKNGKKGFSEKLGKLVFPGHLKPIVIKEVEHD